MGFYKGIKYINKYGSSYDDYGTVTVKDIFRKRYKKGMVKKSEDSTRPERLQDIYNVRKYSDLAVKIYSDYLSMMVDDVIAGDIVQVTPRKYPLMCVGLLTKEESDKVIEINTQYPPKINIRDFGYKLPRIVLFFGETSLYTDRVVHVPKEKYEVFQENLNKGMKYIIFKSVLDGSIK